MAVFDERIFIVRCRVVIASMLYERVIIDEEVDVPVVADYWSSATGVHRWGRRLFGKTADITILKVDGKTISEWQEWEVRTQAGKYDDQEN